MCTTTVECDTCKRNSFCHPIGILDCKGFQSRIEIDPKIILKQVDVCIVNDDQQMRPGDSLHFVYAWENQFPFKLAEQHLECS